MASIFSCSSWIFASSKRLRRICQGAGLILLLAAAILTAHNLASGNVEHLDGESVVFTPWPPGPPARQTSMRGLRA